MKTKRALPILMSLLIAVSLSLPALAADGSSASACETTAGTVNTDTAETDAAASETQGADTGSSYGKGWIEPSAHVPSGSGVIQATDGRFYAESSLPSSYSLVTASLSTSVKNQGNYNTCWTFGAIASAESNLLKNAYAAITDLDLSELQLGYYTYNRSASSQPAGCTGDTVIMGTGYTFDEPGGNDLMTITSLSRWVGAVNESVAPYTSIGTPLDAKTTAMASNSYVLTGADMISMRDISSIKREILANGAVTTAYGNYNSLTYGGADYYNDAACAYYNPDVTHFGPNHEVCIVGWKDDFSKSNFSSVDNVSHTTPVQPNSDGAWLIKNSWGDYNSQDGYFWLSYEDTSMLTEDATSYQMIPVDQAYDKIYQYDGGLGIDYYQSSGTTGYMANVFQASGSEQLQAVSFWTWDWGLNYEIFIYSDVTGSPTTGTLVSASTTSGTMAYSGYHTVKLNTPVTLTAGKKFAVVIKLSVGSSNASSVYLFYDGNHTKVDGNNNMVFSSTSSAAAGQSYYSENGSTWLDKGVSNTINFRIKAFTDNTKKTLCTVSVFTKPNNTAYKAGDFFDPTGLAVTLTYSDSSTENVSYSDATKDRFTFSPAVTQALTTSDTAVTITCDGVSTTQAISVTAIVPGVVAAPVFSPAAGTYTGNRAVTITCATSGAAIYYTTDGTAPTKSSMRYTGPITLTADTTVRAQAFKSGMTESPVVSAAYKIVQPAIYNGVDYSAVYNYDYYIAHNPDVLRVLGSDENVVLAHFVNYGMSEGRQGNETFNVTSYRLAYRDLRAAFGSDLKAYYLHYIHYGKAEGRTATGVTQLQNAVTVYNGVDYSAVYNYNYYIANNPDVIRVLGSDENTVLAHFVNYGRGEGRQGNETFNVISYQLAYRDLRAAFGSDLKAYYLHYIHYGKAEGRTATGVTQLQNAVTVYNGVDYSAVYNYNYYIANNPDVIRVLGSDENTVLAHFVNYGMGEGRQGNETFNVASYRQRYADLRAAFGSNLKAYYLHFIRYGRMEGRTAV